MSALMRSTAHKHSLWFLATGDAVLNLMVEREKELWVGLVHLRPLTAISREEILDGNAGAYTNIIAWATTAEDFRRRAEMLAESLGLFVEETEEEEPLRMRVRDSLLPEELEEMRSRAELNPDAIVYGTFHTYSHDDA